MHLVLSAMGEQRQRTFLKYGVSNYFQCADLSGFLLIQTKSGGSRCSPIVSDLYSTQAGGSGKCRWDLLAHLVPELGPNLVQEEEHSDS